MKRPAFQFYPGDWQKNANLRRCSWGAKGAWMGTLCLMHDADEYGVLRWPWKEIAGAVGCPPALTRELIDKSVMKGVESGHFPGHWYTPKKGEPALLIEPCEGPIYFSSRMVDDEHVRRVRAEGGEQGAEHGGKGAEHGSKGGRPPATEGGKKPPLDDPLKPPPSSSSSSSPSGNNGDASHPLSGLLPDDPHPIKANGHDRRAERTRQLRAQAVEILKFLNEKADRAYEPVPANVDLIVARLKEGATPDQVREVVVRMVGRWKDDPKMEAYLRPATLFNATKFAQYAGEIGSGEESRRYD
jgi:uncharacterized phage protein (TIGR02220 family)